MKRRAHQGAPTKAGWLLNPHHRGAVHKGAITSPMLMRPAGSAIYVNESQPAKAPLPRLVRLAGSSININCRSKAKDGTGHSGGPENADIEASGQIDRQRHRGAVMEGVLTNACEAGGQLDRRQRGAASKGALTEACEAGRPARWTSSRSRMRR